jgi:hypothetical protein
MEREDLGLNKKGKAITSLVPRHSPTIGTTSAPILKLDDWREVQAAIAAGEWRQDHQTGKAWAGLAIAEVLGIDPGAKGRLKELLSRGLTDGYLAIDRRPVSKNGRACPFVVVGDA